jgi:hypothetical protein
MLVSVVGSIPVCIARPADKDLNSSRRALARKVVAEVRSLWRSHVTALKETLNL